MRASRIDEKPFRLYLVRHGLSTANQDGILAGRDNSVSLSEIGRRQAKETAKKLKGEEIKSIFASPIYRCLETAEPISQALNLPVQVKENLQEMDYGSWSGQKLSKLSKKKEWSQIQSNPSSFRFPNGESFRQMQKRVSLEIQNFIEFGENAVIVSHGDLIKMMIAILLGSKLDAFQRIRINPASISTIEFSGQGRSIQVSSVNSTYHLSSGKRNLFQSRSAGIFQLGGGSGN